MRTSRSAVASTSPPSSIGPRLSPWRPPLATASPARANGYSAARGSGRSSSALAATSAATHEAAEPPMPEPRAMPLSISISNPYASPSAWRMAIRAAPAVLRSASSGSANDAPRIAATRTCGASMRRTVTVSPTPASGWPRMSKPTATLPIEAGENALACRCGCGGGCICATAAASPPIALTAVPPARPPPAARRRTRRRR